MNQPRRRPRPSSSSRALRLQVDRLEDRQLLAAGLVARPTFDLVHPLGGPSPANTGYIPSQVRQAYGFNQVSFGTISGNGAGETIAIVDAYGDPTLQSDLDTFDSTYGLPAATVTQFNQDGSTTGLPAGDSTGGWELEESLDVEWAHAMAPGAKIDLFAASTASDGDLLAAVASASKVANVVSMSWGGGEFSGESSYDPNFSTPGVAYVASSGDNGAPISWPAASSNVLAVGGTALNLGAVDGYGSESGWGGSGGGPSSYEAQPAYQQGVVAPSSTKRANPDVAYDASPSTGFSVYDSDPYNGRTLGWLDVGGTSAGAPQWAALLAVADQGRALGGLAALDASSPQQVMTILYANATADFHDVVVGTSTGSPRYAAGAGYDYVTGLGSPIANLVVRSLDGVVDARPVDHLAITGPTSAVAGSSFSVTVTAESPGVTTADASYTGTVRWASGDAQAVLPASYTFTAADGGSHTFTSTLKTAGARSITATDASNPSLNAATSSIAVGPAAASQLVLSGPSSTGTAGVSQSFLVTARDPYGNVATSYADTIQFTSGDAQAVLPASYRFTAGDQGSHAFVVTFETAGTRSITATDASTPSIRATASGITIAPAAPTGLTAAASSTSQINLGWSASAGATGYSILRSNRGNGGFVQVGTTAGTTYSDTGLAAGTTYYYEVRAGAGGLSSGLGHVANATTTGVGTTGGTTDTLWSNSYTPPEDAYAFGSYDVGVKFTASQAGTVTGIRFYKQAWMGGYGHAGDLWSSTGTLLATAWFTAETSNGWQQVGLSSPVPIAANTTYIVSFSTGGGYFGITEGFFNAGGLINGPLNAPSSPASGGNGVFGVGNGSFPTYSVDGFNFWADVAFSPTPPTAVVSRGVTAPTSGRPVMTAPAATATPNEVVPPVPAASSTGVTASHPRPTVATSSFHGRTGLLSGSWFARGGPSRLVTQADAAGLRDR